MCWIGTISFPFFRVRRPPGGISTPPFNDFVDVGKTAHHAGKRGEALFFTGSFWSLKETKYVKCKIINSE